MQKGRVACPGVPQGQRKLEVGWKQASADPIRCSLEESKQGEEERAWLDSTVASSFSVKTSTLCTQPQPPVSKDGAKDEFLVFTVSPLTRGPSFPILDPSSPTRPVSPYQAVRI